MQSTQTTGRQLTPLAHLIQSRRRRDWSLKGALGELLDNSLSYSKGNAENVWIWLMPDAIRVFDDGNGVDDINRLFQLANSSSWDNHDIGLYGVGATEAALWLANEFEVYTLYQGVMTHHKTSWLDCIKTGRWPLEHNGSRYDGPIPAEFEDEESGTLLIMRGLHQDQRVRIENLMRDLGQAFAPALRRGQQVGFMNQRSRRARTLTSNEWTLLEPWQPPQAEEQVEIAGIVEIERGDETVALSWEGTAGLAELTERQNQVFIGYQHRVIEQTRDPFGEYQNVPSVYAMVDLGDGWKYELDPDKSKVTGHRQALMESIHNQIKPLLEKAQEEAEDLTFSLKATELSALIGGAFGREKAEEGDDSEPLVEMVNRQGDGTIENPNGGDVPAPGEQRSRAAANGEHERYGRTDDGAAGSLKVTWKTDGYMEGVAAKATLSEDGRGVVDLNKQFPDLNEAVQRKPENDPVVITHIGYALADEIVNMRDRGQADTLLRIFPDLHDTILDSNDSDRVRAVVTGTLLRNIRETKKPRRRRRRVKNDKSAVVADQ